MILFHGSPIIVSEPCILKPGRTLDYGTGFYTTTSEQQAADWALRRASAGQYGYVNIYELDDAAAFALYEQGLLNKQELIAELKTYRLIDQMVFHTEDALKYLRFIEAKEVCL